MLILYLVILISVSLVVLLIITNRTNLKIRFIIQQIRGIKQELNQLNEKEEKIQATLKHLTLSELDEIKNVEQVEEEKFVLQKKIKEKYEQIKEYFATKYKFVEKFAGENVLDKIGISIFLVGIAFFVSFYNEYKWINSEGQVFFTAIIGSVMIILSFFMHNKFSNFGAVLLGGGIATLIFAAFAAYYQYNIIGDIPILIILLVLISFGIWFSLKFDKEQIAIIVVTSGFLSPLIVIFAGYQQTPIVTQLQTYQYVSFYSYVLILNLCVIVYAYFKKSLVINSTAYIFTFIFCIFGMVMQILNNEVVPELIAFIFLIFFYITLLIIITLNNIKENRKFIPYEFTGISTGTAMFYLAGMIIINHEQVPYKGLFTGLIAVLVFIFVLIIYRRKNYDKALLTLLSALAIVFATLIVPVELVGQSRAMIWSIQSVLFLWVSQRANLKNMKIASLWMMFGMLASLYYDLYHIYFSTNKDLVMVTPIFNKGFLTSMVSVVSMFMNLYLLKNEKINYYIYPFFKIHIYKAIIVLLASSLFYFALNFEIKYYLIQYYNSEILIKNYMAIFNIIFLFILTLPSLLNKKMKVLHLTSAATGLISLIIYALFYNSLFTKLRNTTLLTIDITQHQFNSHYIFVAILALILIFGLRSVMILNKNDNKTTFFAALVFVAGCMTLFSSEIATYLVVKQYTPEVLIQEIVSNVHRLSYTILWCVASLFFVIIGFILKNKNLRTVAIFLYLVALIKLFTFDFATLNNQNLMLALLIFGGVLLMISFVFQLFYNYEFDKKFNLNQQNL